MGLSSPEQIYQESKAERVSNVADQSAAGRAALSEEIKKDQATALDEMTDGLTLWIASPLRRDKKINAGKWDFRTKAGLIQMISDMQALGIYQDSTFYKNIVSQLSKPSDPDFLKDSSDKKALYLDPLSNAADLSTEDPAFVASVEFFIAIKTIIVEQDLMEVAKDETLAEKDKEPVSDTIVGAVKDNYNKFAKAIRNRDYATAGVYVIGLVAMYKAYKSLPQDKQSKYGKWLAWGGALYAGHIFAKNAGYDILKKTGISDVSSDVEGTPLSALRRLDIKGVEGLDYGVFLSVSNTNLSDLYTKYQKTNDPAIQFIAPDGFPGAFPLNLKYDDPDEYQRTGKELYKLVAAFEAAYNKYYLVSMNGFSFEEALRIPALRHSTVFDFMAALQNFAPAPEEGLIASGYDAAGVAVGGAYGAVSVGVVGGYDAVVKYFGGGSEGGAEGENSAGGADDGKIKFEHPIPIEGVNGSYYSKTKGFPIVIHGVNGEYQIFSKKEYIEASKNFDALGPMVKIPTTPRARGAVDVLSGFDKKVEGKIKKALGVISLNLYNLDSLKFEGNGIWSIKINNKSETLKFHFDDNGEIVFENSSKVAAAALAPNVAASTLVATPALGLVEAPQANAVIDINEFISNISSKSRGEKWVFINSITSSKENKTIIKNLKDRKDFDTIFTVPMQIKLLMALPDYKNRVDKIEKEYLSEGGYTDSMRSGLTNLDVGPVTLDNPVWVEEFSRNAFNKASSSSEDTSENLVDALDYQYYVKNDPVAYARLVRVYVKENDKFDGTSKDNFLELVPEGLKAAYEKKSSSELLFERFMLMDDDENIKFIEGLSDSADSNNAQTIVDGMELIMERKPDLKEKLYKLSGKLYEKNLVRVDLGYFEWLVSVGNVAEVMDLLLSNERKGFDKNNGSVKGSPKICLDFYFKELHSEIDSSVKTELTSSGFVDASGEYHDYDYYDDIESIRSGDQKTILRNLGVTLEDIRQYMSIRAAFRMEGSSSRNAKSK